MAFEVNLIYTCVPTVALIRT